VTSNTLGLARALADTSHRFYARGWVLGTSGNFSTLVSRDPFQLAITASGRDKRTLGAADVVIVDAEGRLTSQESDASEGRPSAETLLHVIRLFQNPSGWNPNYTHSGVDRDFQPVCFGPAYIGPTIAAPPIGPA
jgi:methylthioribulose-1-phosphate dehydratase